ncbi:MAG TPA: hypothetical protein VGN17_18930 [Bryobacteraceae bacterium]|jgi:hypothetical protein
MEAKAAGRIASWTGAAAVEGLTLYAGRDNGSLILKSLFAIWVLLPFAVFAVANRIARRPQSAGRAWHQRVMLVLTLAAVAIYVATILWPPKAQAAFPFVIVPPVSVAVLGVAMAIVSFRRGVPRDR